VSYIQYFLPQPDGPEIPLQFRDPFDNNPHPLAIFASHELQDRLNNTPSLSFKLKQNQGGKMFGVLVVKDQTGKMGYLSAFSGMLNQQWLVPGFVPPAFDVDEQRVLLNEGEEQLKKLTEKIDRLLDRSARKNAEKKVAELQLQKDKTLVKLKLQHKKNKKNRHDQRSQLKNDQDNKQVLFQLSLRSQQEKSEYKQQKLNWDKNIAETEQQFKLNFEDEINALKIRRKRLSQKLHIAVFDSYRLQNKMGEVSLLRSFFDNGVPPGGATDCAAPKLIQFANKYQLQPLAIAEFWWGSAPAGGVRHHAQFYPPCRGKCHPLLPFLLKGVDIEQSGTLSSNSWLEPEIMYEDEHIVVLNKPQGLLSIPGKLLKHSVLDWLRQRYPSATGALLVHRLDMATSGLLLAAKSADDYKYLQKQFIERSVKKRYVAVLSKKLYKKSYTIDLPLRVDLDDRPRQVVCYEHGKMARTYVKVISTDEHSSRVYFYPLTGRSHQLRVHAAHSKGLSAPIIGDELYGVRSERLLLHAEKLSFNHPRTGEKVEFKAKSPF